MTSNATYDVRGGTVQAVLAGTSIGLTKSASTLAVLTGANSYTGRTTVAGGTLELGTAAQNAVLNLGGADIQSGTLIFDYTAGSDPVGTIAAHVEGQLRRRPLGPGSIPRFHRGRHRLDLGLCTTTRRTTR